MTQRKETSYAPKLNFKRTLPQPSSLRRRRNSQKSGMAIFNGENLQVLNEPRELAFSPFLQCAGKQGTQRRAVLGKHFGKPVLTRHIFGPLFT